MTNSKIKQIFLRILSIAFLIFIIFYVFHKDYQSILTSLSQISFWQCLGLLVMGLIYLLLDALAYYKIIHTQYPAFHYKQAVEVTMLGVFANVSTSTTGTIPLQSYYLYKQGIDAGSSVSTMMLESVFHKLSVFLYASFMVISHHHWLKRSIPELLPYIALGFFVCACIIIIIVLLCTWNKIQHLFVSLIIKLPSSSKWQQRKEKWINQLNDLYHESKIILQDHQCCIHLLIINTLKIIFDFIIPYYCAAILNINQLSFIETQVLSSIMFVIIGVLPNVAGVGPTEVAYLMLFTPFIGHVHASSTLVLYRVADYFLPFLVSSYVFFKVQRTAQKESQS